MLNARFVPIEQWPQKPTPHYLRKRATFRASYLQTLDLLEFELGKLNAKDILVQAYFTREQLRNDGWPKANANPSDVGIILSFTRKGQPLSFPCDTFDSYDDNIRAIALALEALRAVDRYGVTRNAEQYKGWAQIEAPRRMTRKEAAELLHRYAPRETIDAIMTSRTVLQAAYREACRQTHPDSGNGNHEAFVYVQEAKAVLEGGM